MEFTCNHVKYNTGELETADNESLHRLIGTALLIYKATTLVTSPRFCPNVYPTECKCFQPHYPTSGVYYPGFDGSVTESAIKSYNRPDDKAYLVALIVDVVFRTEIESNDVARAMLRHIQLGLWVPEIVAFQMYHPVTKRIVTFCHDNREFVYDRVITPKMFMPAKYLGVQMCRHGKKCRNPICTFGHEQSIIGVCTCVDPDCSKTHMQWVTIDHPNHPTYGAATLPVHKIRSPSKHANTSYINN